MIPLKISEIISATGAKIYGDMTDAVVKSVCQDSRLAVSESMFFAIKGDAFDGHNFVASAIEKGCNAIVVQNTDCLKGVDLKDVNVLLVDDTVKALQDLSKAYLNNLNVKKVAVTGSTGKTSTRDMIYYVCSEKYKTQKNQGNFNTVVGVPLTILEFDKDIEVAVIEMGMDHKGEIDTMVDIVRPDIGVITNIGISHMENFESRDGIFDAKMEITNYFDENSTLIVTESENYLNRENINLENIGYNLVFTGEDKDDEFFTYDIEPQGDMGVKFKVKHDDEIGEFFVPVPGRHNALNGTLAVAVGKKLGVSFEEAARGLAKIELTGKRLSVKEKNGIKIIDDTYNASPDSMKAALDILSITKGERHIAVLGDMLELGKDEVKYHQEIGEIAREKADMVITVGSLAKHISDENNFKDIGEFIENMDNILKSGDVVLFKGSRGMALDKAVEKLLDEC